ncbi:MAG: hypothetical protein QM760_23040 [Nibricoccus sp.]
MRKAADAGWAEEALAWSIEEPSRLAYADALDLADGVTNGISVRRPGAPSRLASWRRSAAGQEAQDLRWATFEATSDPDSVLIDEALSHFAEFEVLDRAFSHALADALPRSISASEWPLDHAALAGARFRAGLDGRHYQALQSVADWLEEDSLRLA